jgi:hypothetical protein
MKPVTYGIGAPWLLRIVEALAWVGTVGVWLAVGFAIGTASAWTALACGGNLLLR